MKQKENLVPQLFSVDNISIEKTTRIRHSLKIKKAITFACHSFTHRKHLLE